MCSMQLSDQELLRELDELEADRRRVAARAAELVAEATQRGLHQREVAARTARTWLEWRYRIDGGEARGRVRAALLAREPLVVEALIDGRLSESHVRELGRLAAHPRCGHQLPEFLELLVEKATVLDFRDWKLLCDQWLRLADADGSEPEAEANHERRHVRLRATPGGWKLTGSFGHTQGAVLDELLAGFGDAEFQADRDAVADEPAGTLLPRTAHQRAADALVNGLIQGASSSGGRPPEPLVNIVVDQETLERELARSAGADVAPLTLDDFGRYRCQTTSGHHVNPGDALAAALIGRVRRVVFDSAGVVIDLGRSRRLFTGHSREAVDLSSRRCVWAGCDVPTSRCQADHIRPWAANGPSDVRNGAPLCGRHNRLKNSGYRTHRDPHTGGWTIVRPDGSTIERPRLRRRPPE